MKFFLKRQHKPKKIILAVGITVLLCLLGLIFWKIGPFNIKEITVTTDYQELNSNLQFFNILNTVRNQNIFFVSEKKLSAKIMSIDPGIGTLEIKKELPQTLTINIKRRIPTMLLKQGANLYLVDKEGVVFGITNQNKDLPVIDFSLQKISIGSTIDNRIKFASLVLDFLKGKEKMDSVFLSENDLQVNLGRGITLLFDTEKNPEDSLNSLQTILTHFKIESKQPSKIDLRFDKPVLSF